MRGREGLKTLLQRDPRDSERVDRIGLAALTRAPTGCRAQVGRDPQPPLTATDQKPLQAPGDMPAVLKRPDPLAIQTVRPSQQRIKSALADLDGLPPRSSPVAAATAAIACERLSVAAPSTIMVLVPFTSIETDGWRRMRPVRSPALRRRSIRRSPRPSLRMGRARSFTWSLGRWTSICSAWWSTWTGWSSTSQRNLDRAICWATCSVGSRDCWTATRRRSSRVGSEPGPRDLELG
jgi:hypothetical protein